MSSTDKMRQLFNEATVQTQAISDDVVFEKIKTAYTRTVQHRSARRPPSTWRFVMKSPFAKLAAAAAVVIVCATGLSLWKTTGAGIALADVLARVEQIKALRYNLTVTMTYPESDPNIAGPDLQFIYTTWAADEYGWKEIGRYADPNGDQGSIFQERYFLPQKKLFVLISPVQKTYLRRELDDAAIARIQGQTTAGNPLIDLKELMKTSYEKLGRSTMDGIAVEGFRSTDASLAVGRIPEDAEHLQVDGTIWVNVETRLPVRYDYSTRFDFATADGTKRINAVHHYVTDAFQWGVPSEASEFDAPPVPDGYRLVDRRQEALAGKG